jgi:hypothetical protein
MDLFLKLMIASECDGVGIFDDFRPDSDFNGA